MNFLAIDTTMQQLSLALSIDNKEKAVTIDTKAKKHNSTLMSEIDKLLKEYNGEIKDIDVFGVVTGPGSFTGIRVGVSAINAFSFALNKKIVEITALELAAYNYKDQNILAMIDCRNNNYYAALFMGGKAKYMAISGEEAEQFNVKHIIYQQPDSNALINIMKEKIACKEFSNKAKPFYMKKSSAERENGL